MGCASSHFAAVAREDIPPADAAMDVRGDETVASGFSVSLPVSAACHDFHVSLVRQKGDRLGAGVGNVGARRTSGVVIKLISEDGLVSQWNEANPDKEITVGMRILKANSAEDYWGILEELHKAATLDMTIRSDPANVQRIRSLPSGTNSQDSLMLRFGGAMGPMGHCMSEPTLLPHVRAGDCDVTGCAICMEDVEKDEILVQLPCKHAFHAVCAGRWLTSNCHRQCPLCKGDVVTPTTSQPMDGAVASRFRRRRSRLWGLRMG